MSQLHVVFGHEVTFNAVSTAFAIAGGAPFEHFKIGESPTRIIVKSLKHTVYDHTPEMVGFEYRDEKGIATFAKYHFEWDSYGNRGVLLGASARQLAAASAVVKALGGTVSFEGDTVLLEVPSKWPEDSEDIGFEALMETLLSIKPVAPQDVDAAQEQLDKV